MPDNPARDSNWFKWLVGILISLLAAGSGIVALLNYVHPDKSHTLTGRWSYVMKSNISGKTYNGSMQLAQDGTSVSGEMDDPGAPTRSSGVAETYVQGKLKLSRATGMNTAQEYTLEGSGQQLAGTFKNVGDYPDSGTFEIKR